MDALPICRYSGVRLWRYAGIVFTNCCRAFRAAITWGNSCQHRFYRGHWFGSRCGNGRLYIRRYRQLQSCVYYLCCSIRNCNSISLVAQTTIQQAIETARRPALALYVFPQLLLWLSRLLSHTHYLPDQPEHYWQPQPV